MRSFLSSCLSLQKYKNITCNYQTYYFTTSRTLKLNCKILLFHKVKMENHFCGISSPKDPADPKLPTEDIFLKKINQMYLFK